MALSKFKITLPETMKDTKKLVYPDKVFSLDTLTDEEAEELIKRESPYIVPVSKSKDKE